MLGLKAMTPIGNINMYALKHNNLVGLLLSVHIKLNSDLISMQRCNDRDIFGGTSAMVG